MPISWKSCPPLTKGRVFHHGRGEGTPPISQKNDQIPSFKIQPPPTKFLSSYGKYLSPVLLLPEMEQNL